MAKRDKYIFIKEEIKKEIPSINLNRILDQANIVPALPSIKEMPAVLPLRKRLLKPAFTFLTLCFVFTFILAISFRKQNTRYDSPKNALTDLTYLENFGISAYSIVSLADQNPAIFSDQTDELNTKDPDILFLNSHLYFVETLLSTNNHFSFTVGESDKTNYQELIIYENLDILNNKKRYYIYFNETQEADRIKLETLVVKEDKEYPLHGYIKINSEEIITELIYAINDNKDSIRLTNTYNDQGNLFKYLFIHNNAIYIRSNLFSYDFKQTRYVSLEDELMNKHYRISTSNNTINIRCKSIFAEFNGASPGDDVNINEIEIYIVKDNNKYYYQYNYDSENLYSLNRN